MSKQPIPPSMSWEHKGFFKMARGPKCGVRKEKMRYCKLDEHSTTRVTHCMRIPSGEGGWIVEAHIENHMFRSNRLPMNCKDQGRGQPTVGCMAHVLRNHRRHCPRVQGLLSRQSAYDRHDFLHIKPGQIAFVKKQKKTNKKWHVISNFTPRVKQKG